MDKNTQRLLMGAGQNNPSGFDILSSSINDVFSTVLYTGNGTNNRNLTIGPGIAAFGGLSWFKNRSAVGDHMLTALDLPAGSTSNLTNLSSNLTSSTQSWVSGRPLFLTDANGSGMVQVSPTSDFVNLNNTGSNYVVWNFRKRSGFFDIVDYTGNGSTQDIAHNLRSTPGCVIVKRLDAAGDWSVWHKNASTLYLNSNSGTTSNIFGTMTSSTFGVTSISYLNANGGSFRAFLFADNAGGFGDTGSENGITCGTFNVPSTSDITVTLGYEPQFLLVKNVSQTDNWRIVDVQRGMSGLGVPSNILYGDTNNAELTSGSQAYATPTGFVWTASSGLGLTGTHIYIAIRRPNEVITSATSVFAAVAGSSSTTTHFASTFPVDTLIYKNKTFSTGVLHHSRLISNKYIDSTSNAIVATDTDKFFFDLPTGVRSISSVNSTDLIGWTFRRAPGFHDSVFYQSDGLLTRTMSHSLGVVPELIIAKNLSVSRDWMVYFYDTDGTTRYRGFSLNLTNGNFDTGSGSGHTTTQFSMRDVSNTSLYDCNSFNPGGGVGPDIGSWFVAHLFASLSGVSKIGKYTGNGTSQNIDCGFSGGARFVMIKSLSTSGDWVVFDSNRGIVAGADSVLTLNLTSVQDTTTDCIDPYVGGFTILTHSTYSINNSGVSYMYMAIA
jgi:hypothetical protein